MPKLKLNLKDVKTGFDPVPPGKYPIEVVEADIRLGKESQQPYLWLHTKILGDGEHKGRRLFCQHTLNQESEGLNVTFTSVNALLGRDVTGKAKQFELDTDDLIGKRATAVVKWEKDDGGEDRERVRYLVPLEDLGEEGEDLATAAEESEDRPW